jgi:hypothetical protein
MKNQWQLKKTTWFVMKYRGNEKLIPQKSEGISKVIWAGRKEIDACRKRTYPLINDLLLTNDF